MSDSESGDDAYGPPLPPGFKSPKSRSSKTEEDDDSFMPALPPHMVKSAAKKEATKDSEEEEDACGPSLPSHVPKSTSKRKGDESEDSHNKTPKVDTGNSEEESGDEDDMYGPALPPHLLQKKKDGIEPSQSQKRVLGPTLPKGYVPSASTMPVPEEGESSESDEDGFVLGPIPSAEKIDEEEYRIRQLEYRAKKMKDKLQGKGEDKPMQRESWMLELPEDRKSFCGLEARQFRRKAPMERGDRSVWTDTPADKERKAQMGTDEDARDYAPEDIAAKKRDEKLSEMVESYNSKKRAEPLIDMHKKKKKEMEPKEGKKERRPFSREEDMNVNKFDDVQKEKILKKARHLNDRFSSGDRKFL